MRKWITASLLIVTLAFHPSAAFARDTPRTRARAEFIEAALVNEAAQNGNWLAILAVAQRSFPASTDWRWLAVVIDRESQWTPRAANPRSGARGLLQLMLPLHNGRFWAVGCSPDLWWVATCNLAAGADLYRSSGQSPWALR